MRLSPSLASVSPFAHFRGLEPFHGLHVLGDLRLLLLGLDQVLRHVPLPVEPSLQLGLIHDRVVGSLAAQEVIGDLDPLDFLPLPGSTVPSANCGSDYLPGLVVVDLL